MTLQVEHAVVGSFREAPHDGREIGILERAGIGRLGLQPLAHLVMGVVRGKADVFIVQGDAVAEHPAEQFAERVGEKFLHVFRRFGVVEVVAELVGQFVLDPGIRPEIRHGMVHLLCAAGLAVRGATGKRPLAGVSLHTTVRLRRR